MEVAINRYFLHHAEASCSEDELLARFAEALKKQFLTPDRRAFLVLDASGIVTPHGAVERFVQDYRGGLKAAPDPEVWWVDQTPGGVGRLLWP